MNKSKIEFRLNNQPVRLVADPEMPLLYALREHFNIRAPKYGCGQGLCGSCRVLLNEKATNACTLPLSAVQDQEIKTLEGISVEAEHLHPIQEAFFREQAAQCGFCLNGMMISAYALIHENKSPNREAIVGALEANLCRCGIQHRVIRAIERIQKP